MSRIGYLLIALVSFTGCSRLEKLTWEITPEKWLATHSHMQIKIGSLNFIFAEPSSTFFVYGLGFVILAAGIFFLKTRGESRSRLFWGIALILWSLSTFSAGTSYQAFSYEIKCSGRSLCLWTSWWEIWYLMLFVAAMNVIAAAVSFSSAEGKLRKGLQIFAAVSTIAYVILVLTGAFMPDYFLSSFEFMVMFPALSFLVLFVVNFLNYRKKHNRLDLLLIGAWVFMLFIVVAYFGFYLSGIADVLWSKGIWFNANDVLHLLLILWIVYLYYGVSRHIKDSD